MRYLSLILVFIFPLCSYANENKTQLYFTLNYFYQAANYEFYIDNNKALYIDTHWDANESGDLLLEPPKWNSLELSNEEIDSLITKLSNAGVKHWKPKYPIVNPAKEGEISMCHRYRYALSIKSSILNIESRGECDSPEELKRVIKIIREFFRVKNT
jgi:hypothetical protein